MSKRYEGTIFGFNYDMEFDTDEEFLDWLMKKLRTGKTVELWEKIVTRLLNESTEFKSIKEK